MEIHVVEVVHGRGGIRVANSLGSWAAARDRGIDVRVHLLSYNNTENDAGIMKECQLTGTELTVASGSEPYHMAHLYNYLIRRVRTGDIICITGIDQVVPVEIIMEIASRISENSFFRARMVSTKREILKRLDFGRDLNAQLKPYGLGQVSNPPAAIQAVPRKMLQAVRGYDERMPMLRKHDIDLNARLERMGLENSLVDSAKVVYHQWHDVSGEKYTIVKNSMAKHNEAIRAENVKNGVTVVNPGEWKDPSWLSARTEVRGWWDA